MLGHPQISRIEIRIVAQRWRPHTGQGPSPAVFNRLTRLKHTRIVVINERFSVQDRYSSVRLLGKTPEFCGLAEASPVKGILAAKIPLL